MSRAFNPFEDESSDVDEVVTALGQLGRRQKCVSEDAVLNYWPLLQAPAVKSLSFGSDDPDVRARVAADRIRSLANEVEGTTDRTVAAMALGLGEYEGADVGSRKESAPISETTYKRRRPKVLRQIALRLVEVEAEPTPKTVASISDYAHACFRVGQCVRSLLGVIEGPEVFPPELRGMYWCRIPEYVDRCFLTLFHIATLLNSCEVALVTVFQAGDQEHQKRLRGSQDRIGYSLRLSAYEQSILIESLDGGNATLGSFIRSLRSDQEGTLVLQQFVLACSTDPFNGIYKPSLSKLSEVVSADAKLAATGGAIDAREALASARLDSALTTSSLFWWTERTNIVTNLARPGTTTFDRLRSFLERETDCLPKELKWHWGDVCYNVEVMQKVKVGTC